MVFRSKLALTVVIALGCATLLALSGCGRGAPSPTQTPVIIVATPEPTATATEKPSPTTAPPTVAPTATKPAPTVAATATRPAPTSTPEPTRPAATSAPDRLKPATTPTTMPTQPVQPTQPTTGQKSPFYIPSAVKGVPSPSPTAVRKGVANANVDPQSYLEEIVADLQLMAESLEVLGELIEEIEGAGELTEAEQAEVLSLFEELANTVREVYNREVARDYPPQYKEIDDYYVETTRYASRTIDTFLKLLQTGDEGLLAELETHAGKFEFFASELIVRLQKL